MKPPRILVVDDEPVARKSLQRLLSKDGHKVQVAGDGTSALGRLSEASFDLVITDMVMDGMSGLELLKAIKRRNPQLEVIVVTGHASIRTAVEATRLGAYYYLEKPFPPEAVRHLVSQALESSRLRARVRELEDRVETLPAKPLFIGESQAVREVLDLVRQVARTDFNVLLTGESGTGKELTASLIHFHSRRKKGPFLAINCGAFTEELLANELFGHERGAFTGASGARVGLLESANGGSLLLDEVGDMPPSMQVKLLRVLQQREVMPVGGTETRPIDARVMAATNKDLTKAVDAGLFRQDLFFRLNVITLTLPPLRERREDIPLLAQYFLNKAARQARLEVSGFSDDARAALQSYAYPGNVRELENVVERAVALARGTVIGPQDLPPDLTEMDVFHFEGEGERVRPLGELERDYVQWVLDRVGRNKTKAAKLLGIHRASLWRHLKRLEIDE